MMLTAEQVARLALEVDLGLPIDQSLVPDTEETRRLRDSMLEESRLNPTVIWDIPFEVPDVVIPAIVMPEDPE